MKIEHVRLSGFMDSIRYSGLPMATEPIDVIDQKDWTRGDKLAAAPSGSGHDCFLKGVQVTALITAPQYWWLQFMRYHFADIISSQSKMHRITKMDIPSQVNDYVDHRVIDVLEDLIDKYENINNSKTVKKLYFQKIIATSPMGLELAAGITTNYLQLKSMYKQRRNHKLIEWQEFCDWIESLHYSEWITGKE